MSVSTEGAEPFTGEKTIDTGTEPWSRRTFLTYKVGNHFHNWTWESRLLKFSRCGLGLEFHGNVGVQFDCMCPFPAVNRG